MEGMKEDMINLPKQMFKREENCIDLGASPNFVQLAWMLRLHLLASRTSSFFVGVCLVAYNQLSPDDKDKPGFIEPTKDHF
jgi:hypothetical protein